MSDTSGGNVIVMFLLGVVILGGLGIWAFTNPSPASVGIFIVAIILAVPLTAFNFN